MSSKTISNFTVDFIIAGKNVSPYVAEFKWKSFVNNGYVIAARISDVGVRILKREGIIDNYLNSARSKPTYVEFSIYYDSSKTRSNNRRAILSNLKVYGTPELAQIEFIAIDPPTWYLNRGRGDGKVYNGNISSVITQTLREYLPNDFKINVSPTSDDANGYWPMMRQDPATFIKSLLSWSSSLTPYRTNWLISNGDDEIKIQEQSELAKNNYHYGNYNCSLNENFVNDVYDYELRSDSIMAINHNFIFTQGISAVSGRFLDFKVEPDKTSASDKTTPNKINAKSDKYKSFKKSNEQYGTSITSIPEFSGGELGVKYENWIDGKPRDIYVGMLPQIMKCRFTIDGDINFSLSEQLGVSTISINWKDVDGDDFFLSGRWLVYGFVHNAYRGEHPKWYTDVYAYRYDYDAEAIRK